MSAKTPSQQARRTSLSLTAVNKQHQQQQTTKAASAGGANGNASANNASNKIDHKSTNAKTEQPTVVAEVKEVVSKDAKKQQQQPHAEKTQSQTVAANTKKAAEKVDEKKSQNGHGKSTGKQQNGNEENGNSNESVNAAVKDKQANATVKDKPANATVKDKQANATAKDKQEKCNKDEKKDKDEHKNTQQIEKKTEKEIEKKPEKETRSKRIETESAAEKKKAEKAAEIVKIDLCSSDEQDAAPVPSKPSAPQTRTATPTKAADKAIDVTPTKAADKTNSPRNKGAIVVTEDVEMQPLPAEDSPAKGQTSSTVNPLPAAASTPTTKTATNKRSTAAKSDIELAMQNCSPLDRKSCPRNFSQISGRRSIRPLADYTPSQFQNNLHFRESYRRINTELDVTSTTNTSLNVTVGSEAPNSSSFSFFGRGRKRDRTPPNSQSAMELQTDADYSPPKRARLESLLYVVSSPLTLLRSRFSKTVIQNSTPAKLRSKLAPEDEVEVQNVSGVSIEEETEKSSAVDEENTTSDEVAVGNEMDEDTPKKATPINSDEKCVLDKIQGDGINVDNAADIEIAEAPTVGLGIADTSVKNKRCRIM